MLTLPRWRREAVLVAAALVALEAIVFHGYFSGSSIPQFDFVTGYNEEAYAWWHDGSFFSPPQWMPYLWGGYPSVSNFQNGSFYLPVGIAAAFGPFTLHASAILSAVHVGAGALGAYVFARAWGIGRHAALLALIAWFFGAGFYSNASHLDIMRAYAWVPWVLLVASVRWPWRRWWAGPVGVLVVWQAILGMYPGILVAFGYTVTAWIITQVVVYRPRTVKYLIPLAIAGVAAVLMTMLRFLPALSARGYRPFSSADLSTFGPINLGTFLFPYDNAQFGTFAIFASYALPATTVAALAFTIRKNGLSIALAVMTATAALLGLPFWPWSDWLGSVLPGMNLSRFRASDFKVILLFGLTMLAVCALDGLMRSPHDGAAPNDSRRRMIIPGTLLLLVLVGEVLVGVRYAFSPLPSALQWLLLLASSVLLVVLDLRPTPRVRRMVATMLAALTAVSGVAAVYAVPGFWLSDRGAIEQSYLGASVDDLIASQQPLGSLVQRPALTPPPPADQPQDNLASVYGSAYYSGRPSLYGNVNLRGTETFEIVRESILRPGSEGASALRFWISPGILVQDDTLFLPSVPVIDSCVVKGECGKDLASRPVSYIPNSTLSFDVTIQETMTISANEPWYPGWTATLCQGETLKSCQDLVTYRGAAGQIQIHAPRASGTLTLTYRLPHQTLSWLSFWIGSSLAGILVLVPRVIPKVTRRPWDDDSDDARLRPDESSARTKNL